MRKFGNALLGLITGVVSLPIMLVAWPIGVAVFMWNETDKDRECAEDDEGGAE